MDRKSVWSQNSEQLQNTRPLIYMSLHNNSVYCVTPRSSNEADKYHILGWVENKDVWNCSGVRFARSLLFLFALRPFCPSITLSCKVNTKKNPSQSPPLQSDGCSGRTSNFLWSKRPKQALIRYGCLPNADEFHRWPGDRYNDSSYVRDRMW